MYVYIRFHLVWKRPHTNVANKVLIGLQSSFRDDLKSLIIYIFLLAILNPTISRVTKGSVSPQMSYSFALFCIFQKEKKEEFYQDNMDWILAKY